MYWIPNCVQFIVQNVKSTAVRTSNDPNLVDSITLGEHILAKILIMTSISVKGQVPK